MNWDGEQNNDSERKTAAWPGREVKNHSRPAHGDRKPLGNATGSIDALRFRRRDSCLKFGYAVPFQRTAPGLCVHCAHVLRGNGGVAMPLPSMTSHVTSVTSFSVLPPASCSREARTGNCPLSNSPPEGRPNRAAGSRQYTRNEALPCSSCPIVAGSRASSASVPFHQRIEEETNSAACIMRFPVSSFPFPLAAMTDRLMSGHIGGLLLFMALNTSVVSIHGRFALRLELDLRQHGGKISRAPVPLYCNQ